MDKKTKIVENLEFLKMIKGVTLEDIKRDTGLVSIGNYTSGKNTPPLNVLIILAEYFEVSLDKLVLHDLREEAKPKTLTANEPSANYGTLSEKLEKLERQMKEIQEMVKKK